jgi:hypothetical protein
MIKNITKRYRVLERKKTPNNLNDTVDNIVNDMVNISVNENKVNNTDLPVEPKIKTKHDNIDKNNRQKILKENE